MASITSAKNENKKIGPRQRMSKDLEHLTLIEGTPNSLNRNSNMAFITLPKLQAQLDEYLDEQKPKIKMLKRFHLKANRRFKSREDYMTMPIVTLGLDHLKDFTYHLNT